MKKRKLVVLLTCFALALVMSISAFAHSGRTDSSGGHKDNKNKSGLGSYHYHCGGHPAHLHPNGVCPYGNTASSSSKPSSSSAPTPTPTPTPKKVYASSIKTENAPTDLNVGDSWDLKATVVPENAEDSSIKWKSENSEIASVTEAGHLIALHSGKTVISASTERGTTAKFTVAIHEVLAERISITNKPSTMHIGDKSTLSVNFTPENTTDKSVTWTSSADSVLSVAANGTIVAKGLGSALITATHGEQTDCFVLSVVSIPAENIVISFPKNTQDKDNKNKVKKGEHKLLEATISPENATDKTVSWSVSDETVGTIDQTGRFTALSVGKVTVTAETENGKKDQIEIEVYSYTLVLVLCIGFLILATGIVIFFVLRKRKKN